MRNYRLTVVAVLLFSIGAFCQMQPQTKSSSEQVPKLEHFDPNLADHSLDPCQDFYKFACNKWNAANPIPPDQVVWGTGSGLRYWNENILREAMEKAAAQTSRRSEYQQKIGDYWAACMDEPGLEQAGIRDLKPELDRINSMMSTTELAEQLAHIHMSFPGAWDANDNQSAAAMFGFGQQQDYDDASKVVAAIDQGGLGLPNRDFYLKDDDKSKEIREKYVAHITKMLTLAGEGQANAGADAKTIIEIETAMAKVQMDNVARRDPKNVNNKMSLDEVQALTPSFKWNVYLQDISAPPSSPHYLVSSPDFFKGWKS